MTPEEQPTQPDAAVPECQDCGACCFWENDRYVFLWGGDHAALTPHEQRTLVEFHGTRCFMRMQDDHCVALGVEGGRFACTIYPRRPFLCGELQRGDEGCDAAREQMGARARRWLQARLPAAEPPRPQA